jgi:hypothetical protein
MNDPFEEQLRALRPTAMPAELRERLTGPPQPSARRPDRRILWLTFATAAAACVTAALFLNPPRPPEPTAGNAPQLAAERSQRVTSVRPLSVVTDESNRAWRLIEVQWVEEDTLVAANRPSAVQLQDHYRTVVPVAISFD